MSYKLNQGEERQRRRALRQAKHDARRAAPMSAVERARALMDASDRAWTAGKTGKASRLTARAGAILDAISPPGPAVEPAAWKVRAPKTARSLPPSPVVPRYVVHGPSGSSIECPDSVYERQQRGEAAPAWKPAIEPVPAAPVQKAPELKGEQVPTWVGEPEDQRVDLDPFDHEPAGVCPRHGLPLGSFLEGKETAYCICPEETCTVWPMPVQEAALLPIVAVA